MLPVLTGFWLTCGVEVFSQRTLLRRRLKGWVICGGPLVPFSKTETFFSRSSGEAEDGSRVGNLLGTQQNLVVL